MASTRKSLVLAKIEVTQFTDPTPTPAANAILVKNQTITPLRVESEDRALIRAYFGNSEMLPVMEEGALEFDVEMAGSGTAGTAPGWGVLMRGSAMAEVITATVSAAYNPISAAFEYLTIYFYDGLQLFKMTGAAGTWSLDMAAKKIPHFKFRFIGKYVAATDAGIPAGASYTLFQQPKASIPTWTGTLLVGAYAAKTAAFNLDIANEINHALWMNLETIEPVDRKPRGSITVEAVALATKNYFSDVQAATQAAFEVTHGTVAGNKVKVAAPKMQLVDMERTDFSGSLAWKFNTTFSPNTGNDEVIVTAT